MKDLVATNFWRMNFSGDFLVGTKVSLSGARRPDRTGRGGGLSRADFSRSEESGSLVVQESRT